MRSRKRNQKDLNSLVERAIKNQGGSREFVNLGVLPHSLVKKIKTNTGLDLTGYSRIIDYSAVRHVIIRHFSENKNSNLVSVTKKDIFNIQYVLINAKIHDIGRAHTFSNLVITWEATLKERFFYLEEIREGRKKLALKTMYKKKRSKSG